MTITALAPTGEVRQTSSTGGQKGTKPERYDLIPIPALQALGQAFGQPFALDSDQNLLARIMQNMITFWGNPQEGDPLPDGDPLIAVARDALIILARSYGEPVNPVTEAPWPAPARFDLIPPQALAAIATHYGVGALKYADNNWRLGYPWSHMYAAMHRHLAAHLAGQPIDEETGSPHLAAVVFHAFGLYTFAAEHPAFDDRFTPVTPV